MSDRTLRDVASFVRSKNAGPFAVTIDIFFAEETVYRAVRWSGLLSESRIADIYGVPQESVRLFAVDQALAIKISLPRPVAAGDFGDSDVAGGQQFLPLLDLVLA